MSPSAGVRSHTRRNADGTQTVVKSHRRKTKGPSSRGAKRKALRAFKMAKRGRKGPALKMAGIAAVEGLAWALLQGVTLMVTTFVLVFVGALVLTLGGSAGRRRRTRRRRPGRSR